MAHALIQTAVPFGTKRPSSWTSSVALLGIAVRGRKFSALNVFCNLVETPLTSVRAWRVESVDFLDESDHLWGIEMLMLARSQISFGFYRSSDSVH